MQFRLVKNKYNLGFFIVKDTQKRLTINIFYYRIQI